MKLTMKERVEYNHRWLHKKTAEEKKEYWKKRYARVKERKSSEPWVKAYHSIYQRIWGGNNKIVDYRGKKPTACYSGIKMLLKPNDLKMLWFRDKAYEMKVPSIDRIDSGGDYTLENSGYCELSENVRKPKKRK